MMIDANFKGLKYARDLPIDHVYGVPTPENAETNDLAGTMKNAYNKEAQLHFDTVDVDYKPQFIKKNLKPPKPTKSSALKKDKVKKDFETKKTETPIKSITRGFSTEPK